MRLHRVATDSQQVAIVLGELVESLRKPDQLGRADQRKITGIEDQDQPATAIIRQPHPASRRIGKARAGKIKVGAGLPIKVEMAAKGGRALSLSGRIESSDISRRISRHSLNDASKDDCIGFGGSN